MMVEEEDSMEMDLPCMMVIVRGASVLFSGNPPLHRYMGSLHVRCVGKEKCKKREEEWKER